jgi:hypothetical protein
MRVLKVAAIAACNAHALIGLVLRRHHCSALVAMPSTSRTQHACSVVVPFAFGMSSRTTAHNNECVLCCALSPDQPTTLSSSSG